MSNVTKGVIWQMVFFCILNQSLRAENSWKLASPDKNVVITVKLIQGGDVADYPVSKVRLYYTIEYGRKGSRKLVMPLSPLGISRKDQGFVDDLTFVSRSKPVDIDRSYTMSHGKRSRCRNHATRQILTFKNINGFRLELILRAYNDGVAFRYRFPESVATKHTVVSEATGFHLPTEGKAWMQAYDKPAEWAPAYEGAYQNGIKIGTSSPEDLGWSFPALFHLTSSGYWVLLTEAAVDSSYCGSRIAQDAPNCVYRIRFPDPREGNHTGYVEPSSTLPWTGPWRVVMIGNSLDKIVESTIVTDLNPPSTVTDTNWIEPGRVSWSWWSDSKSPRNYTTLCKFVDLAAEMDWEYSLVDAEWTEMENGNIHDLVKYSKAKGVGLILWYNAGGKHNTVRLEPDEKMHERDVRRKEFQQLQKLGVKGVKVDCFNSDKQNIMQLYIDILQDAADYQMMVNFHGCTLPRGWSRTYPHLMTIEAVRGAENYKFSEEYSLNAPRHNTILPFTRNVLGPMDYTPLTFTNNKYAHVTTYSHELALSVIFESGWLHCADSVEAYRTLPDPVKDFLRKVPTAWDDIHFIDGYPGEFICLARRKGNEWFIGAINAAGAKKITVPLDFLEAGDYKVRLFKDGETKRDIITEDLIVSTDAPFDIEIPANGGTIAHFFR